MTRLMRSLAQLLGPSDSSVPRDDRHCPLTPGKVIWTQAGQGHGSLLGAFIITAPLYTEPRATSKEENGGLHC